MDGKFTIRQFQQRFPTDEACLEEIKLMRFGETLECPKCHKTNKFYKIQGRMAYSCAFCRHQIYPLVGTIFYKTTTPLRDWFYAMYLMAQTRAGISAKQLERELGCTYKTAWRMFHMIRSLMADDTPPLKGDVEIDETYIGKRPQNGLKPRTEQAIFGAVERGGRAKVKHVKRVGKHLIPVVEQNVDMSSRVFSDDYLAYRALYNKGWKHQAVKHVYKEWVRGEVHTQNIENLWGGFKRGMRGVYIHCDPKYLQAYIDEYAFRYSNRDNPNMFDLILSKISS